MLARDWLKNSYDNAAKERTIYFTGIYTEYIFSHLAVIRIKT